MGTAIHKNRSTVFSRPNLVAYFRDSSVSVAVARLAAGVVPGAPGTVVTLPALHSGGARALSGLQAGGGGIDRTTL